MFVITNLSTGSLLSSLIAAVITAIFKASFLSFFGTSTALAVIFTSGSFLKRVFSKTAMTFDTIVTKIAKKTNDIKTMDIPRSDVRKLSKNPMYSVVIIPLPPFIFFLAFFSMYPQNFPPQRNHSIEKVNFDLLHPLSEQSIQSILFFSLLRLKVFRHIQSKILYDIHFLSVPYKIKHYSHSKET